MTETGATYTIATETKAGIEIIVSGHEYIYGGSSSGPRLDNSVEIQFLVNGVVVGTINPYGENGIEILTAFYEAKFKKPMPRLSIPEAAVAEQQEVSA